MARPPPAPNTDPRRHPAPDRLTGGCCEKIEDALAEMEHRNKWHLPQISIYYFHDMCEWTSDCGACMDKQRDACM